LVSYQEWDEFEKILGGRYLESDYVDDPGNASDYKHDIEMKVSVADKNHPVTRNMNDFIITDEGYSNLRVLPSVKTLLTTDHQHCARKVAWANEYNNSTIVYLLLGHDNKAFQDKNYQRLLFNAIEWVSRKPE
ncbi:MAG: ThuA domain-containing protein, partial [Bacteroidota bacterium]